MEWVYQRQRQRFFAHGPNPGQPLQNGLNQLVGLPMEKYKVSDAVNRLFTKADWARIHR